MQTPDSPDPNKITRLTEGIRVAARLPSTDRETPAEYWKRAGRHAFDTAGLVLSDEEFERGWRALWQCAFMGGNYRSDAIRVLRAIADGAEAAGGVR